MAITESRTNTPSEVRTRIMRAINIKRPVFLWGPPGVGKSEVVESIADELGGLLVDLRLGQMEPTDIRGIPFFNKNTEKMDWAPPVDLPDEQLASQYPVVVLFLDEMNTAAPAVQAAGYQLILNRRVGKYKLPDNVVIVAAGNRDSDKGVTYRMPTPLANRFVHLEVRADFDSWQDWATQNFVHQDVVGYLGFAKNDLMNFDPKTGGRAFATPRSWSFVSQFLQDETITEAELYDLISGTVGEGTAIKFMAHRKIASKLPKVDDILSGKVKTMSIKEISAMYSLTIAMCYALKENLEKYKATPEGMLKWQDEADNYLLFMMDNFTTELVVMGGRTALTTFKLPISPKMKSFVPFHEKYGHIIRAAAA